MAMSTKDTLLQIIAILESLLTFETNMDKFENIAGRLSKIANKEPAWSWRYVQSVASGTVEASKKFADAVQVLAVSLDGVPVVSAKAVPVTVYAEKDSITEGSYVMSGSKICANPACTVTFVPNVPWRKLCPICSPIDKKVTA